MANAINTSQITDEHAIALREFFFPSLAIGHNVTPKSTGKRLKQYLDGPVKHGDRALALRSRKDINDNTLRYHVEVK